MTDGSSSVRQRGLSSESAEPPSTFQELFVRISSAHN